jgi:hypothetical protein
MGLCVWWAFASPAYQILGANQLRHSEALHATATAAPLWCAPRRTCERYPTGSHRLLGAPTLLAVGYGVSLGGRPMYTPRAFARTRPSPVRARINSRSNSAKPPSTVSINRPWGVVVSAHASANDLNMAPAVQIANGRLRPAPRIRLALDSASPPSLSVIAKAEGISKQTAFRIKQDPMAAEAALVAWGL